MRVTESTTWGALAATWAVAVGLAFWLAGLTSPYLPKYDDWFVTADAVSGYQPITAEWLWRPHNNHRMVLPKLAYVGTFHAMGGDFRAAQFASVGLMALSALLAMGGARFWRGHSSLADAFFPLLLLHWGQCQLFQQGAVMCFTIPMAMNYAALFLLLRAGDQFNGWWALALLVCMAGMTLSGMPGFLMAIPYLAWLCGAGYAKFKSSRREGGLLLAMALVGGVVVGCGIIGVPLGSHPTSEPEANALQIYPVTLAVISAMSLGWLGYAYFPISVAVVFGTIVAAVGYLSYVALDRGGERQPEARRRALILLAFMAGGAMVLASLVYGRHAFTGEMLWSTTRYAGISVGLLVGCYFACFYLPGRARTAQGVMCLLAGVVFVGSALEVKRYCYGYSPQLETRAHEDVLIRDILSGKSLEESAARFFVYENGYTIQEGTTWLGMLREKRLGVFGMTDLEKTQFLDFSQPDGVLALGRAEAGRFLGDGWAVRGTLEGRWTVEDRALLRLRLEPLREYALTIDLLPFVIAGKIDRQRLTPVLNGKELETLTLESWAYRKVTIRLPATSVQAENELVLLLPDSVAPKAVGHNDDPDPKGVWVRTLEITPK